MRAVGVSSRPRAQAADDPSETIQECVNRQQFLILCKRQREEVEHRWSSNEAFDEKVSFVVSSENRKLDQIQQCKLEICKERNVATRVNGTPVVLVSGG